MPLQIRPQVADESEGACQPIGVSDYELARLPPDDLTGSLPTIEEIEQELENITDKRKAIIQTDGMPVRTSRSGGFLKSDTFNRWRRGYYVEQ